MVNESNIGETIMHKSTLLLAGCLCLTLLATADPPKPVKGIPDLQGRWFYQSGIIANKSPSGETLPAFLKQITEAEAGFEIDGSTLKVGTAKLTISNDGFEPKFLEQIANGNGGGLARPYKVTAPDGTVTIAGLEIGERGFTLRYPAGCCSRSGTVVHFAKSKPEFLKP
jgi:hypothetical protein